MQKYAKRRNRRRMTKRHHLRGETLEKRQLLATVTVGNTLDVVNGDDSSITALVNNDGGDGISLREAIQAANNTTGADTVNFDANVFTGGAGTEIRLGGTELVITESLMIDGSTGTDVLITGDKDNNDVTVGTTEVTDVAASLANDPTSLDDNSRVINFSATTGDLTIDSLTITGGRTTGTAVGGGIFSLSDTVTINNSTVSGNSSGYGGGGIFMHSGVMTLTGSTVNGNFSTLDGGGIADLYGHVTLDSSTVSGNNSSRDGGGIFSLSGAVTINSSTVSGNSSGRDGGGMATYEGVVSLSSSTVTNNTATFYGGGISVFDTATNPTLTLQNSIVADNTAGNSAPDLLSDPESTLDVDYSLIGDASGSGITGGTGTGNVLYQSAQLAPLANNGGPTQTHALLTGSPAIDAGNTTLTTDQRGIARPLDHPNVANAAGSNGADIGAVEQTEFPSLIVTTATDVVDATDFVTSLREAINFANSQPGADTITFDSGVFTGAGSVIRLGGTELVITESLTIDGSTGTDVLITGDTDDDDITVGTTDITDVAASFGGTSGAPDDLLDDNSRVFNFTATTGDLTLEDLGITGGRTTGNALPGDSTFNGGGVRFMSDGNLAFIGSTLSGNSTTGNLSFGGGIFASSGDVILTGSTVSANAATGSYGGGIFTYSGAVTLTDSTVSGNSVIDSGGGIFTNSGAITLNSSTVSGNNSDLGGGGLATRFGAVTLTNSTVSGNTATGTGIGGGIFTQDSSVLIDSSTITGNSAAVRGGGILSQRLTIRNSIIAGNTDNGTAPDVLAPPDPANNLIVEHSLIGDDTGSGITGTTGTGNLLNQSAQLGLLADNGGPTQTHALLPGSPAIDAGDPNAVAGQNNVPEFDQRGSGFSRVRGLRLDMGAYEDQANAAPLFTSSDTANVPENTQVVHSLTVQDDPTQTIGFRLLGDAPAGELGPGASLGIEDSITSPDGLTSLLMQGDGNLVAYRGGMAVWASETDGSGAVRTTIQSDGNLVMTTASGSVVYETNSSSDAGSLARLRVTNAGNPEIIRVDGAKLWEGTLGNTSGGGTVFTPDPLAPEFAKATDTDRFQITGGNQLQFQTAPDFETPADANGDNVYEVSVLADDGNGGVTPQTIQVTVDPVNDNLPVFISPPTANVDENTQAVHTLDAIDADLPAQTITFSIAGSAADNGLFEIVGGNQLQFKVAPDFENPTDVGGTAGDNTYEVSVLADDGNGGTTPQTIQVTVDAVNDNLPIFISPPAANVDENTQAVHTLDATDADLPAQAITFSIAGAGADNDKFEIVGGDQLQFISTPDFETPADDNVDNIYEVSVLADDGNGGTTPQTIQVMVTDEAEPMSYVVDILGDENDGNVTAGNLSLREAIALANANLGADTITFDSGVFTGSTNSVIRLGGTELVITDALTIDGSTGTDVLITADAADNDVTVGTTEVTDVAASLANDPTSLDDNSRVINFTAASGDLTLTGLTVTGGRTTGQFDDGGGIRFGGDSGFGGTLTLDQSSVSGNATEGTFADGGGIDTTYGNVMLMGSTVSGNSSGNYGGGIYAGDNVTLIDSTVSGNSSGDDGGGIRTFAGNVTLTNSTVNGNTSGDDGGGIRTSSGVVTLTNSTVSGNSSGDDGGGIRTFAGSVTLTNSAVSGNTGDDDGGGIATESGNVTLTASTVSGNSTSVDGGGIATESGNVTLAASTVSGNSTSVDGGGIATIIGAVMLNNSTVAGNSAAKGGGVFVHDTSTNPALIVDNSIIAGNTATTSGPDLRPDPDSTLTVNFSLLGDTSSGLTAQQLTEINAGTGNLLNQSAMLGPLADNGGPTQTHALLPSSPAIDAGNTTLTIDQRGIVRPIDHPNVANAPGGNGADIGAVEQTEFPSLVVTTSTDVVDATDFLTSLREAISFANSQAGDDTITFDATVFTGGTNSVIRLGGSELLITESLTIDGSTGIDVLITGDANDNDVTVGTTEVTDVAASLANDPTSLDDNSRVINFSAASGDLTLTGLTVTGGRTTGQSDHGGGIRFGVSSGLNNTLTLDQSTVSGNAISGSHADGGGIYAQNGNVAFTYSTVGGNTSGDEGGGIFALSGNVTLTDSTVSGNTSGYGGGGIYSRSGNVTLTGSTVSGNTTAYDGGGIEAYGNVALASSTVSGNTSGQDGGGIYARGEVTLLGSTVSGNTGGYDGGGIDALGNVTLTNSAVSGNTSSYDGGGIAAAGGVTLTRSTVSGNTSGYEGGGIYSRSGNVTLTNSTISGNSTGGTGGGINVDSNAVFTLNSSTVTNNSADIGGGVFVFNSSNNQAFMVDNSIIAGNTATTSAPDLRSDPDSTLTVNFSLIGDTSSGLTAQQLTEINNGAGNLLDQSALLGPLADNGGSTLTHALLPGSPAIDAGNTTLSTDQRHILRPLVHPNVANAPGGNGTDIGAVEQAEFPSLVVTTATDVVDATDFVTSLREAINFANSQAGADTITFDSGVFTGGDNSAIRLDGMELVITETLTIDGSTGADVLITGDAADNDITVGMTEVTDVAASLANNPTSLDDNSRVINFSAASGDLALTGLTVTGGRTTGQEDGGGIRFGASYGSGFAGTLTLDQSTASGNITTGTSADGGGIFTSSGNVTLTGSTVSGNSSGWDGGGIYTDSGNVTLTGSTVSGNTSVDEGGGIYTDSGNVTLTNSTVSGNSSVNDGGGIRTSDGNVTLTNSTVSGNSSVNDGGGIRTYAGDVTLNYSTVTGNSAAEGGGVFVYDSSYNPAFVVSNSIIAGNTATTSGSDLRPDPDSTLTVNFSLIGDTSSGLTAQQLTEINAGTGNVLDQSAMLVPLADKGGPTQTHAPLPGSPAIDAGDPAAVAGQNDVPLFDQRGAGFDRVVGGRIDMGSVEVQQPVPDCDFDGDLDCDIDDIDALVMEIVAGTNNPLFDLTGDTNVDLADRDQWLADAGAMNLASGNPYLLGDANLDGVVDGQDFIVWNSHKFMASGKWSQADWDADGVTDGRDFLLWNSNKFQSADVPTGSSSRWGAESLALSQVLRRHAQQDREEADRTSVIDKIFADPLS